MESFPGQLSYVSDGTQDTCGLYLISEPDQLIEVTFVDFDVKCETGGLLAVSEILQQFFAVYLSQIFGISR